jgi:hypothetical protein
MSVVDQFDLFLRDNPLVASDPLAAAAMVLAADLDGGGESVAQSAVAFQKLLVELRRMLPEEPSEVSKVDELQHRRRQKMGAAGA